MQITIILKEPTIDVTFIGEEVAETTRVANTKFISRSNLLFFFRLGTLSMRGMKMKWKCTEWGFTRPKRPTMTVFFGFKHVRVPEEDKCDPEKETSQRGLPRIHYKTITV